MAGTVALCVLASPAASADPPVLYGDAFTLSGEVEREGAGRLVIILARPHGRATFSEVARTRTDARGRWSRRLRPLIRTVYRARIGRLPSRAIVVEVEPRIALTGEGGRFSATVRAARSFAGKYVVLQRRPSEGPWRLVRRLVLDENSSTRFTFRHPRRRTQIRLLMPRSQVGPGYVAASSAVITLTRR